MRDRAKAEAMLDEHEKASSQYYAAPEEQAGEAFAAYTRTRAAVLDAMTLPDGWVLVPKVMTMEMHKAFTEEMDSWDYTNYRDGWAAACAAVQQPKDPT
jgi:hypothetical protein